MTRGVSRSEWNDFRLFFISGSNPVFLQKVAQLPKK